VEFLLSWLADYVDLAAELPLERDAHGRHWMRDGSGGASEKGSQLGKRLTAIGLAVEGTRVHAWPVAGGAGSSAADRPAGGDEIVLDVDVTSNRPDCMNHYGLARELAVALGKPLQPDVLSSTGSFSGARAEASPAGEPPVRVVLDDPEGCPRYTARAIRGVTVGPSPAWLRRRLEAIGQRSINNVVDATNYVLWELGQPLHAFDLAKIRGGEIRVRRARAGERLRTLDGVERVLSPEILVIADAAGATALGGIMGGAASEVGAATVDVLLEAAHFDRRRVRAGARALGMHTDASHRFERGADLAACDAASRRCAALIAEVAGGTVDPAAVDALAGRAEPIAWRIEAAALDRFAGFAVAGSEIAGVLSGLGFAPRDEGSGVFTGTVPSWRVVDFEPRRSGPSAGRAYPQDLYEEVLRHVGFERMPAHLPTIGGIDPGTSREHDERARIREHFVALGYAESVHYAFHDAAWDERCPMPFVAVGSAPLRLANPLSERYAILRRSLVPNLVAAAEFNFHREATGVRLFEIGHLFPGGRDAEIEAVAAIVGGRSGEPWDRRSEPDLLALKGAFEELIERLGLEVECRPARLAGTVAGTGGEWLDGDRVLGWFGEIDDAEIPQPVFAAELRLDRLPAGVARPIETPPRLPGISVDWTLTHAQELPWAELAAAVRDRASGDVWLRAFRLKDRYQGAGLPAGAVATTIRFDYHGGERTLTQDEVNARHAALTAELERRFGVARR
jgi:phenylalanyl-tRNA synthetase beta chain